MKVVIDGRYVRNRASGIKSYTTALVEHIPIRAPQESFEIWVHPETNGKLVDLPNVRQRPVPAPANGPGTLINTGRLGDLENCDVFHATFNILGHGVRCPSVVTIHDMRWIDDPALCEKNPVLRPIRKAFMQHGIRNALYRADHILTVSQASADIIDKYFPWSRNRVSITPCACDACFMPPTSTSWCRNRAAEILRSPHSFFMAVGVNALGKGHDLIIRAFAASALPKERLVMIHRSDGSPRIEQLAKHLGVYGRIHWLRDVSESDLVCLMQATKAFLQPSRYEGFGIPVLEAMSCGAPVIASDIPALTEVLDGAGIIVPCGEVRPLAHAMRRVADNSLLGIEMRLHGLERVRDFSWQETADKTLHAYKQAARNARAYRETYSQLEERSYSLTYDF